MGDCACDVQVDPLDPGAPPSHFFLELTPACNHACPGCGNVYPRRGNPPPLSALEWRAVMARLLPMAPRLRLTGGEPTRHPEVREILAYLDVQGLPYTLFTNADWADPEAIIGWLAARPGLEGLLVSLHGARAASHQAFTAIPGSFAATLANARRAAAAGLRVCTSTVITRHNSQEMAEIVALAGSIGAERATFSRFIGPPLPHLEPGLPELATAVQALERLAGNGYGPRQGRAVIHYGAPIPRCFIPNRSHGCMAGFAHATIDPWGNLRPCPHAPFIAGNLLEEEFEAIWRSEAMHAWRTGLLAQCQGCSMETECRGACQAQAMWRGVRRDPLLAARHAAGRTTGSIMPLPV